MPSLYLSAAHKSSGKTTVTLGLCRALRRRGLGVQPFKKGPDYIDPIWHSRAAGQACYNLDYNMMTGSEIDALYARHALAADIALVEGNKGLYDGMDLDGSNSNAALAKQLGLPVVLVIDTIGMTRGIAPLLLGYRAFDPEIRIAGVILNKVGGPRHEAKLREVVGHYTDIPVLGALHKNPALAIVERHLGLIPGNEVDEAEARIERIADVIDSQVDLDAVLAVAAQSRPLGMAATPAPEIAGNGLRIGIVQDRAFGFYYNEDLDTLRSAGVLIHVIDALRDTALPEIDGLLIGGGFPEAFIEALAGNEALKADIRRRVEAGLPVYAECGGLMYLSRSLRWGDRSGAMVGLIPGDAVMGERPVGRGYAILRARRDTAQGLVAGSEFQAHEFHYSHLENLPPDLDYAYDVVRGHGLDGRHDGFVQGHLLASYCHRRGTGPQGWIAPFLDLAQRCARRPPAARLAA